MKDFEKIDYKKITGLKLLIWKNHESKKVFIEKILMDFDKYKLIIEVCPDYDEIKTKIVNEYKFDNFDNEYSLIDFPELDEILGKKIRWFWQLKNNQGYDDAIQIELNDATSYQFVAMATFIWIKKLDEIKVPYH